MDGIDYKEAYDVFLSYRRDGGETMAILLRDRLTAKGYRVFLDVESLNSGSFNERLLRVIEGCTDFIMVLSKGSLDRCVNEGDWVRTEIAHALYYRKNIVPIMLRGFEWPQRLPDDIEPLRIQNGVNANSNEYFDAAVDRLVDRFLLSKPSVKQKKASSKAIKGVIWGVASLALVTAIVIGGFALWGNRDEPPDDQRSRGDPRSVRNGGSADESPEPQESPLPEERQKPAPTNGQPDHDDSLFENISNRGNTSGNIINGGQAVAHGDIIFFTDGDFNIYMFDTVSDEIVLLYTESGAVANLNCYNGVLYYSANNRVNMIDLDTMVRSELARIAPDQMFIENDTIYFTNTFESLRLFQIGLDGRVSTQLNDMTDLRYRVVSDGYFFFSDNSQGSRLYRTNLDGSDRIELTQQESHWTNVIGGHVFSVDFGPNPKLVRLDSNGDNYEVIMQTPVSFLNVTPYGYICANGRDRSLMYIFSFDGTTETRLTDFPVRRINVAGDWVFFANRDEGDALYVIRVDGTELQRLTDFISSRLAG